MKYDDATWHSDGEFPGDLPAEAGGTHIAMFLAWALLHGHGGSLHTEDFAEELALLRGRELTPNEYLFRCCDGQLTNEDLDDTGNAFAAAYFDPEHGGYLLDYASQFADRPAVAYRVPMTWDTYDRIAPVIDQAYGAWRDGPSPIDA